MLPHLRANLWLFGLSLLLCCVLYPAILLGIGQAAFPEEADGSLLRDASGKAIGSRLIAQPFTGDEYFQPRPSAASYNAAASGASNWGASNPLLRDRVARQLGPIVKYASGPKKGQPVGPDVEQWFQSDRFHGQPGIVSQWAASYPTLAQNWVKGDKLHSDIVAAWWSNHVEDVAQWMKQHPENPEPKPEDLAEPFFKSFAREHAGAFPTPQEHKTADGKTETRLEPARSGTDIQATFFDLWCQEQPHADLQPVPADMVMASGSGLDPHITLKNALYQLDRVAAAWATRTHREPAQLRAEIETLLHHKAEAPFVGLIGVELINVLEINLELRDRFSPKVS